MTETPSINLREAQRIGALAQRLGRNEDYVLHIERLGRVMADISCDDRSVGIAAMALAKTIRKLTSGWNDTAAKVVTDAAFLQLVHHYRRGL